MSIEDDRIEKLKRKLYSRTEEPALDLRADLKREDTPVQNAWGNTQGLSIPEDMATRRTTHPVLKKFLFAAAIFFLLSVALSLYVFFGGSNLISSSNVDIQVAGPSTVASGEEVDLSLSLLNQNHADLEQVSFTADYPDGVTSDATSNKPMTHSQETIGTIPSGSSVPRTIKLFLFGDKGTTKTIRFQLAYNVAGSNAVFTKEKDYDITIGSSPVIMDVSAPQEVNSGQEMTFTVNVASNSSSLLQNVIVVAEYPYGFTFDNSSSAATKNNTIWNIGDLKSGDKKTITINGKLAAQDGEQRTFRFSVGTKSTNPSKDIDTVLGQAQPTITVSKPFISASLALNGNTSDTIAVSGGGSVGGVLSFTNTLPNQINDVSVNMQVSGAAIDQSSVRLDNGGFYQSTNSTGLWDKNSTASLSFINPGDSNNVSFTFNTLRLPANAKNPQVNLALTIKGSRTSSGGSVDQVQTTVSKTIKVSANLSLSAKALRGGAFTNTGPLPPKAQTPTTYTADLTFSNMWNDVTGARVVMTLPPYVDWTGNISPTTANIAYDANSRTITWAPDSVSAGAGFSLSPKEVSFQLKITPSLSQVGSQANITSDMSVSAQDTFSGQAISFTVPALTTQASDSSSSGLITQ